MELWKTSIVAILNINKDAGYEIIGTGFIVDKNLVVTCAHVIEQAKVEPGRRIYVHIPGLTEYLPAHVSAEWFSPSDKLDIAFIHLPKTKKTSNLPIFPLGSSQKVDGHSFSSFGFTPLGNFMGVGARGEIITRITDKERGDFLQLRSQEVAPGMSGGPIFDLTRNVVVGMVNSGMMMKTAEKHRDTAFATPSEALLQLCPQLQAKEICPYRNLRAFTEQDKDFFFGRKKLTARLLQKLQGNLSLLAVVGASGSGKSSVVQAGLIPQLRKGKIRGSKHWEIALMRPGKEPFANLTSIGLENAENDLAAAVQRWLTAHPATTRFVLVIDQFEELFTVCSTSVRQQFAAQLAEAINKCPTFTLIMTLRTEFYNDFIHEMLTLLPWFDSGSANIDLSIDDQELLEIIEEPAKIVDLKFEPGLVQLLINDIKQARAYAKSDRASMLPLLEFTLTGLWERRTQERTLTSQAYRELGGVTGSISEWADGAYRKLDDRRRALARRILTDLVQLGDENVKVPDTRRRLPINQLIHDERERAEVLSVIEKFADDHLLVTATEGNTAETVDLIHEALLQEWEPFKKWLNEDREFLRWQRRFKERRDRWLSTNKDAGLLLGGSDLQETDGWRKSKPEHLSAKDVEYLDASQKASKQIKRERRALWLILRIAAVVAALIAAWYIIEDKTWYRFWPIFPACPQVRQVGVDFKGEKLPKDIEQRLNDSAQPAKSGLIYCQSDESTPTGVVSIIAKPASEAEKIELTIALPEISAYRLDFLPEIRKFGPENVSDKEAIALIKASAVYGVGNYGKASSLLKDANTLSGLTLLAQAYLYQDKFNESREIYDKAIALSEEYKEPVDQLQMGAALAWWRPIIFEGSFGTNYCETAGKYYEAIKPWNGAEALVINSKIVFAYEYHCNDARWKNAPPLFDDQSPQANDIANYVIALRCTPYNVTEGCNYEKSLLAASESLLQARFFLSEYYWFQKDDCQNAKSTRERFEKDYYSHLDTKRLRSLLKNQNLLCSE